MFWRVGVGAREEDYRVGVLGVRGPDLLPVDQPLVALELRSSLQRGEIGSSARLRVALRPNRLAREDLDKQVDKQVDERTEGS